MSDRDLGSRTHIPAEHPKTTDDRRSCRRSAVVVRVPTLALLFGYNMQNALRSRSRPGRGVRLVLLTSIVLLSIVTAWNLTRSEALAEAERSYARVDLVGCLQHALDHLDRR